MSQTSETDKEKLETITSQIDQELVISESSIKFKYGIMEQRNYDMPSVAKKFFKNTKNSTDLLPPVTRWVSKDMSIMAIERPPFSCTIKYQDIQGEISDDFEHYEDCDPDYGCECEMPYPETFEFNINVPWTVWFFENIGPDCAIQAKVFCRPGPLNGFEDTLYALPVTNIYPDGAICWGSFHPIYDTNRYDNFSAFLLDSVNGFWTDMFNNDLTTMITEYSPEELRGHIYSNEFFASWSRLSMDEVLALNFRTLSAAQQYGNCTFGEIVDYYNKGIDINNSIGQAGHVELSKFFWGLLT